MGGHLGEETLYRNDGPMARVFQCSGHRQAPCGKGFRPFRIRRNPVGKRLQVAFRTGNGCRHVTHVHQGIEGIGQARIQLQGHRVQGCRIMLAVGESPSSVRGEGDRRLLRFDVGRRQDRSGRDFAKSRVQGPEDRFRPLPAAGSQEQECEYRMDGYSFHDSRFIVRPAGRLFLPPSPPPGHR